MYIILSNNPYLNLAIRLLNCQCAMINWGRLFNYEVNNNYRMFIHYLLIYQGSLPMHTLENFINGYKNYPSYLSF